MTRRPVSTTASIRTLISPVEVNFSALLIRFSSACRSSDGDRAKSARYRTRHGHVSSSPCVGPEWQRVPRRYRRCPEIKVQPFQLQFACFDFGEVEDVVDDRQKRFAGLLNGPRQVALPSPSAVVSRSSVMPRTPFMGVRISWLMLARNCDFVRLAASAVSFASRSSWRCV